MDSSRDASTGADSASLTVSSGALAGDSSAGCGTPLLLPSLVLAAGLDSSGSAVLSAVVVSAGWFAEEPGVSSSDSSAPGIMEFIKTCSRTHGYGANYNCSIGKNQPGTAQIVCFAARLVREGTG